MGDGGGRAVLTPRLVWVFPVAYLCLLLPIRIPTAVDWTGLASAAVPTTLIVLPLLYAIPRTRVVWTRHRGWLLAAQAVLTYLPFAVYGQQWVVSGSGLLCGLLLLTVAAPRSWVLFGVVVAAEPLLRIGVVGVPAVEWESMTSHVVIQPVTHGLVLFGLVRLGDLVADLHATRSELAALAVSRERLRAGQALREAVGNRLTAVTERAGAALELLPHRPQQARGQLTEAAGIARQMLEQIRAVGGGWRAVDHNPPTAAPALGRLAPRLARLVLVTVLCGVAAQHLMNVLTAGVGTRAAAGAAAVSVATAALQLYHSTAWRDGARPRAWPWTLTVQALLSFAFFPLYGVTALLMAGFTAGAALLLLPGRWAWAAFVAVVASVGTLTGWRSPWGIIDVPTMLAWTAMLGLVVYGLSRLAQLAEELQAARQELARAAVAQERLRVAQDTHDLLGLGLSAVALKSDLAGRMIGRDDAKARSELNALLRLAAEARADVRAVAIDQRRLSLHAELDAAREVLASAGVDAEVRAEPSAAPLPEHVDTVMATVLREAVTNVLRHANATRCEIELTAGDGGVRLKVANDGVTGDAERAHVRERKWRASGRGLVNLAARATSLDGRLTTHAGDGRFELTVWVPLTPWTSARLDGERRPAAGDPADGVDEDVDGTVLDQEP